MLFYYGRPARRLDTVSRGPAANRRVYVLMLDAEWDGERYTRPAGVHLAELRDQQQAPIHLVPPHDLSEDDPRMAGRRHPTLPTSSPSRALTGRSPGALEGEFQSVWVAGEVSNLVRAAPGHLYFSLKDEKAVPAGRAVPRRRPAAAVRSAGRHAGRRPRPDVGLRAARRLPARRSRSSSPKGIGAAGAGPPAAPREAAGARATSTRGARSRCRAFPRTHRPGHQPDRGGGPRHARTPRPPLAGRRASSSSRCRVQGDGAADEIAAAIRAVEPAARGRTLSARRR